ncbi:tRNA glutamyl-Q(34) synthetase GluQRS [Vibrio mangrovi]|nr:tRNA glutamyl-Q(34) synthetase GluQRS [Vibrio mangrovi]MDW6003029.1 tRNA glutamyl-Q(34) synthetase GluQRS [Vibrio mangrovi]
MNNYIGRFAPSPSGPLHFGSLVAALGSYFQARAMNGQWLVRIEDLDPPREMPGAADLILKTLEAYGLHWDHNIWYQSRRHDAYQAQIDTWLANGQAYYCRCTRKQIKAAGDYYNGTCRHLQLPSDSGYAVRLRMDVPITRFYDEKHGDIDIPHDLAQEDFIIKRRDGLFAYNLAVVLDDIAQGVTQVVRGADLIEPTGRQISLYNILEHKPVSYLHLPLAVDQSGHKLSKQNHAPAIDLKNPRPTLIQAMKFLGFQLPAGIETAELAEIVAWGSQNWHIQQLPDALEITR